MTHAHDAHTLPMGVIEGESASQARAGEDAWRKGLSTTVREQGAVLSPVPASPERRMFTARPRRVSWVEKARDIYADIKVEIAHKEAITRW